MGSKSSNSGGEDGGDGDDPSAKSRVEEALETLKAAGHRDRLVLVPPDDAGTPKKKPKSKAAKAKADERARDEAEHHLKQINFVMTDNPTLRKLILNVGDAITTAPGADPGVAAGVAAAVNAVLGNERLRKLVLALLVKAGDQPDDAAPGDDTALLDLLAAIVRDPGLRQACAFVAADGALRGLCIALGADPKLIKAFALTQSGLKARAFFQLMWAADTETQQNLITALNRPEILKLVVTACAKKQAEAAIRTAIDHPEAPALGVRVLRLRGFSRLVVDAAMKWSAAGPR